MAFNDLETGFATARPVELFKFTGSYNTYRMTSYVDNVTNSEGTYTATVMRRSKIQEASQEETGISMDIELPYSHPMVTEYAFQDSPPSLIMEFWRAHPENYNDKILMWKGNVLSWSIERRVAKIKVPSVFSYKLSGQCPPPKYQGPCNHVLYDERCAVDPTSFTHSTTVLLITENIIVLNSNPFADDACNAGEMIYAVGGERRMVIDNVGTSFTVSSPFAGLEVGATVSIRQGCDHRFTTCRDKFSNGINFGGFPLVPTNNPFASRL